MRVALDSFLKRNRVMADQADKMRMHIDLSDRKNVEIKCDFGVQAKHDGEKLTQANSVI